MAKKLRPRRRISLLALGFAVIGSSATGAAAQDFMAPHQSKSPVSQVGYYDRAPCACANNACSSCTPACGNGCSPQPSGLPQAPPVDGDYTAPMIDPNAPLNVDMDSNPMPERDLTAPVAPSPLLASSFGTSSGGNSSTPNVIGDFFGGGLNLGANFAFTPESMTSQPHGHHAEFASAPIHGGDRLLKITEFNSPIPVDRVFFTYNHFHNALQESIDGDVVDRNLNRMVFGAEKTFNSGNSSVELRIPFAAGLDAVQNTSDSISDEAVLFGDIAISLKTILLTTQSTIYSGGLGITLPTGRDAEITHFGETLFIDNEAVHLSPYFGALHRPNDQLFLQGFLQFNFDLNGNAFSSTLGDDGVIQDQTLMFLSGTIGYWIYQNPHSSNYVTGIAPVLELHYTSTLNDADSDGSGGSTLLVNNGDNRIDVLNMTMGSHFQLGPLSTLTAAVVVPLKDTENKLFDTELGVQFNRRF